MNHSHTTLARRDAFSLVEMLVALAIFAVLLAAVFVPIKLAGDLSGVGVARAGAQQAGVDGLRQLKSDITRATVILPNTQISGVTSGLPYSANGNLPYLRDGGAYTPPSTPTSSDGANNPNACRAGVVPAPNTARLDLIMPSEDSGTVNSTLQSGNVVVSYYCRRLDISKAFDPINNPVVLFRAQIPFRYSVFQSKTILQKPFPAWGYNSGPPFNASVANSRFDHIPTGCTADDARAVQWLTMNQYGEFDLAPLALPGPGVTPQPAPTPGGPVIPATFGSHNLVLPRDQALLTPYAPTSPTATGSLVPDVTFSLSSSTTNGPLDRVKVQLSVGQYDQNSVNRHDANGTGQTALQPQVARTLTLDVVASNIPK